MTDLLQAFDDTIAGIVWSLWKELGVSGVVRFHENCLVQPEELIILTMLVAKYDPRIRDEALDWASRYHELIQTSRLRTFLKELGKEPAHAFSQFATALSSISPAKWLVSDEHASFEIKMSKKSSLPSLETPSLLMLRFRKLFGVGVKADVLTYFLTRNKLIYSVSDLVEIGYSKKSIIAALDQLADAGLLAVTRLKNRKNYELKKPRELQALVGKLPKIAPPWDKILQAVIAIRSAIPDMQKSSGMAKGVFLRKCLIGIEALLPAFITPILQDKMEFEKDWKAVIDMFHAFEKGNFSMQFEVHNEFEKIVFALLGDLYRVDDCVDGLEMIESDSQLDTKRHTEVYKPCYQLFLSFLGDLEVCLNKFLNFPFYKIMDEQLADVSHNFSQEKRPTLLARISEIKRMWPIDRITNASLATQQYRLFAQELYGLRLFIHALYKRLQELYFLENRVHLLVLPTVLYKRHAVNALFLTEMES